MNPGMDVAFFERGALMFQVTENLETMIDGPRLGHAGPIPGALRPTFPWSIREIRALV
jgi:hypothetical protein